MLSRIVYTTIGL